MASREPVDGADPSRFADAAPEVHGSEAPSGVRGAAETFGDTPPSGGEFVAPAEFCRPHARRPTATSESARIDGGVRGAARTETGSDCPLALRATRRHTLPMSGKRGRAGDGVWGLFFLMAYIGAAIYFVSHSGGGFWPVILGLLQAFVWPVYVIYHVLSLLHA